MNAAALDIAEISETRLRLVLAGHKIVPAEGKIPRLLGWQKLCAGPDDVPLWESALPTHRNTGVLTARTPAMDIDIRDADAADAVEELLRERFGSRGNLLVRYGQRPKRAIPFRTEVPFKKIFVDLVAPDAIKDPKPRIEALGDGQQFIVHGIHPDTRQPYAWEGGCLWNMAHEQLPILNEEEAREFVNDAADLLVERFGYQRKQTISERAIDARTATRSDMVAPADTGCPLWLKFLLETTGGDAELVRFLQQWLGYCLTGSTQEHALIFCYGPGGNGKGSFLNTTTRILGDYATTAAMDTFAASKTDRHPTDLAMLRGARIVAASETEEGRAWAEARIKTLTGGDKISARFMRQDFFEYYPQFKLTIIGNHRPILNTVDDAMRRRINMIPFMLKPPVIDRQLEDKLLAEAPGILQWMIDGCLDWQANGLIRPAVVQAATADYFAEQDSFGHWVEECCDVTLGRTPPSWELSGSLFASWADYCRKANESPGSQKTFASEMRKRGFEPYRVPGMGSRAFKFIRLKEPQGVTRDTL
jgi:P4 family phage/plasmid primase-like protien